jgi:hypothetical protein
MQLFTVARSHPSDRSKEVALAFSFSRDVSLKRIPGKDTRWKVPVNVPDPFLCACLSLISDKILIASAFFQTFATDFKMRDHWTEDNRENGKDENDNELEILKKRSPYWTKNAKMHTMT